jgi:hypothetical protein
MKLIWWDDIGELPSREYLVKKWLDKNCFSCVYGPNNSGKTFFTADLALHVAMGWEWRGHKVNQGAVIYIAPEGGNGLKERLQALKTHYELEGEDVPFALLPYPIDLCHDDDDARDVSQLIKEAGEALDLEIALIIADTVSMALHGGDDSSSRDMGAFVVNCNLIRQETQAHILGIHHPGKDEARGMRGSTVLISAVDTSIEIKHNKTAEIRTASIEKQRDHAPAEAITFTLKQISLGVDDDGDPITSCVVVPSDKVPAFKEKRLTGDKAKAMEALYEVLNTNGRKIGNRRGIPNDVNCANVEDWRQEFYSRKEGEQGAKQRAFRRALKDLEDMSRVAYRDELVWIISKETEETTI